MIISYVVICQYHIQVIQLSNYENNKNCNGLRIQRIRPVTSSNEKSNDLMQQSIVVKLIYRKNDNGYLIHKNMIAINRCNSTDSIEKWEIPQRYCLLNNNAIDNAKIIICGTREALADGVIIVLVLF